MAIWLNIVAIEYWSNDCWRQRLLRWVGSRVISQVSDYFNYANFHSQYPVFGIRVYASVICHISYPALKLLQINSFTQLQNTGLYLAGRLTKLTVTLCMIDGENNEALFYHWFTLHFMVLQKLNYMYQTIRVSLLP